MASPRSAVLRGWHTCHCGYKTSQLQYITAICHARKQDCHCTTCCVVCTGLQLTLQTSSQAGSGSIPVLATGAAAELLPGWSHSLLSLHRLQHLVGWCLVVLGFAAS